MRTSIAMATYNGARHITGQLESFTAQTILPDELVVCDDCSTDNTAELLQRFSKAAPFKVRVFQNEKNLGYGQNFGKAMSLCDGDLVFLSDHDDVWFPEKIETVCGWAKANPERALFMNDAECTDENLVKTGITKIQKMKKARVSLDNFVQGCCCAVRKNFLKIALPIPEFSKAHDTWLVGLTAILDVRLVREEVLQLYRIHGPSASNYYVNTSGRHHFWNKVKYKMSIPHEHRQEFEFELSKLSEIKRRLSTEFSLETDNLGIDKRVIQKGSQRAEDKFAAVRKRKELTQKSRFTRFPLACQLLINGMYIRHFNGFQSFIRDLLA